MKNSPMPPNLQAYVSTSQAAKMLGLSVGTVQRMVQKGIFKAFITHGGHRRILSTSLQDYFKAQGFAQAEDFFIYLRDSFDALYAEGADSPKMMSVGMHCRLLGRPGRIVALQKFMDHIERHDRVWVCRRIDVAQHWRQVHPYQETP